MSVLFSSHFSLIESILEPMISICRKLSQYEPEKKRLKKATKVILT